MEVRWAQLNQRQRQCLQAIYTLDQEQEQYAQEAHVRGEQLRPGTARCWLPYGVTAGHSTVLWQRLHMIDAVDVIFELLEYQGLIQCMYETNMKGRMVHVRITPTGRTLMHAVQDMVVQDYIENHQAQFV
ncbi:MAG: hypothetical protein AAGF95_05225 [Chloroflexota bacterium]